MQTRVQLSVENSHIVRNTARSHGAGIHVVMNSSLRVDNTTAAHNTGGNRGGKLAANFGESLTQDMC